MSTRGAIELELCWGTLQQIDVVAQIGAAAAAGFGCVTISPSQYMAAVGDDRSGVGRVRGALDDSGTKATIVDCLMGGLPGSPDPGAAPAQFRDMFSITADDCFRILDEVGGESLQVAHFLGEPVPVEQMTDAIGKLTAQARARGYGVLIEFMPGNGIPDYPTASAIVEGVGDSALAVTFDTWHFARTGGDQRQLDSMRPGIVGALQLNDCPMPAEEMAQLGYVPMSDRNLPGQGMLPLFELLGTILEHSGPVRAGIEVFSSELRALRPVDAARRVWEATAGVLGAIGYDVR